MDIFVLRNSSTDDQELSAGGNSSNMLNKALPSPRLSAFASIALFISSLVILSTPQVQRVFNRRFLGRRRSYTFKVQITKETFREQNLHLRQTGMSLKALRVEAAYGGSSYRSGRK